MIDLTNVYEIRNVVNDKEIDKIEDELGNIIYEAWKILTLSGMPPLTLQKCKGADLVDYKIYGDSVQEKKNLLPYPYRYDSRTINGVTFTVNDDGSVIANGTATADTTFLLTASSTLKLKPNRYVVSGSPEGSSNSGYYMVWQNKSFIYNSPVTVTLTQEEGANIYIAVRNGTVCENVTFKPQLELGSTATDWQSPVISPDNPIEIESVGEKTKNLFDLSKVKIVKPNGNFKTAEVLDNGIKVYQKYAYSSALYSFTVEKDMTVTFSYKATSAEDYKAYVWFVIDGKTHYSVSSGTVFNLAAGNNVVIYFAWQTYKSGYTITYEEEVIFTDIQLEEGENATEYEPYGYKIPVKVSDELGNETVTTNIYLKEPLRKISDYTDYIDFENGKVVRNIGEKIFDGTESFGKSSSRFQHTFSNEIIIKADGSTGESMCNYFTQGNAGKQFQGLEDNTATPFVYGNQTFLSFAYSQASTATEFKAFLLEKFNNGKPVVLDYVLEKEKPEDIDLPNIPTHKGTTVIEIDTSITPSNMEVQYYGKRT